MPEVDICRESLAPYCVGCGVDLGFGGSPILPTAICIDREEGHSWRAKTSNPSPTHIIGDVRNLQWFKDNSMDYVFSSHVLEDFQDTTSVLAEWLRVIRPGGHLVLYLPDQETYAAHCIANGSTPNQAHKHADFSLAYVKTCLGVIGIFPEHIIHEQWPAEGSVYSFELVVKKP